MTTIPEGDTAASFAAAIAGDMASEGVEALEHAEMLLSELQSPKLPLTPEEAADAAQIRGSLLAVQAAYAAFAVRVADRLVGAEV